MCERRVYPGKRYRHFKGNLYKVLYIAKHSETLEEHVVYQALYGEQEIWIRPLDIFLNKRNLMVKSFTDLNKLKNNFLIGNRK